MTQECNIDKIIKILDNLLLQLDDLDDKNPPKPAPVNNIEQPSSEEQSVLKKPSLWIRVKEKVKKLGKTKKNEARYQGSCSGSSHGERSKQNIDKDQENADLIHKLQSDIRQMRIAFKNLTQFQTQMSKSLEFDFPSDKLKGILKKTDSTSSKSQDLKELRRKIFNLKCQIPSLLLKQSSSGLSITDSQTGEGNDTINETGSDIYLPGLHVYKDFLKSLAFEEVLEKFQELDFQEKVCLLSLAVFPENKEVKRTMLMYWWIGEGFLECDDSEISVTRILDDFSTKGLLEPIQNERKLKPNSYKMEPHVHAAVIYLAEFMELFDLYSLKGKLIMKKSTKQKVCLVKGSSLLKEAKASKMEPGNLETIFNSSERYPDFTSKWFPSMASLKVLYLGRWERTAKRHIEVECAEFLMNIKALKNLKLASFQGISRIEYLKNSICELRELVILDLRACYNLETLPKDIGLLKNLIYLDVSECYMLDRMPKGVSELSRLQVLKGFVISQSDDERNCAVKHLVNLRKLSITVNNYGFKVENLMESLKGLEKLESLKISWGARFPETEEEKRNQEDVVMEKKELKEQEDEKVQKKGQTSKRKMEPEDGRNEKANVEEGKKQDEVFEGEKKKKSPSEEAKETIQKKLDDQKGKNKVEDKEKVDLEEGKKSGGVEEEKSKSEKKASPSPPGEVTRAIQNKLDDENLKSNVEAEKLKSNKVVEEEKKVSPTKESLDTTQKEEDGDKEKVDQQKEKKHDEDRSKSNKVIEEEKKVNPTKKSLDTTQKEEDGDKEKVDAEEGKKHDEDRSKSNKVVEEEKKASPTKESLDTTHKEEDEDKDKEKVDQEKGKKRDEDISKSNKVVEEEKKENPPKKSSEMTQKEEDGDKEKVDQEKRKNHDEDRSKSNKVGDGDAKASPPQDKDMIQNKTVDKSKEEIEAKEAKPDDGAEGDKKTNSSHEPILNKPNPDKVTEGDEKTNLSQESKDTIRSKLDDNKVQENGETETHKSNKIELVTKSSFLENSKDLVREKQENHEKASPSRPESSKSKLFIARKWRRRHQEKSPKDDTPKLPSSLKKLELECFPEKNPPDWLKPENLYNLEKLSIKGGNLSKINDEIPTEVKNFNVQILRLKYLHELKAEWKDFQALFPKMILLEKYKCPKVAFCPTDGNGVWRSPNM